MADVSTWSATAASNNATPPDGWPENMLPSQVNDTGREMMAAIRRFYDDVVDQVVNGSFYATANGGTGGYHIDGFMALSADNSDTLYVGASNAHWTSMYIGSIGGNISMQGPMALQAVAVSGLPAASLLRTGQMMTVINALTPTYGAAVVGGGTEVVTVVCNSADWICR